jgi:integrase
MKTKFRLYKLDDARHEMDAKAEGYKARPYNFKFTFRKKCYPRCLDTTDAGEAQAKAKRLYTQITESIIRGESARLDATKLRAEQSAPLAEILTTYRSLILDANAATREQNIRALLRVLSPPSPGGEGRGEGELQTKPIKALLTPDAVKHFFATPADTDDELEILSHKRTLNSTWAKAKSLFSTLALANYRKLELYHPCIEAFLAEGVLQRKRKLPDIEYNPPTDTLLQTTLDAWGKLTDRNLFLAIGLELAFGLRIGEVAQARWSWLTVQQGYPTLDGRARVKNNSGLVQVRALDPFYKTFINVALERNWVQRTPSGSFAPIGGEGQDEGADYIITGSAAFRADGNFRAVSDWLRSLGWETRKTNHALRAYAGSQVAMRYGIYEAQVFLRHSSVKVTEDHYSHFVRKFKPANVEELPARWAVCVKVEKRETANLASPQTDASLDASGEFRYVPLNSASGKAWMANIEDSSQLN